MAKKHAADFISKYRYQPLTRNADPAGNIEVLNWHEVRRKVSLAASRYSMRDLEYMRTLAHASPGHPVDLVLWTADKQSIEWSARLHCVNGLEVLTPL